MHTASFAELVDEGRGEGRFGSVVGRGGRVFGCLFVLVRPVRSVGRTVGRVVGRTVGHIVGGRTAGRGLSLCAVRLWVLGLCAVRLWVLGLWAVRL
ncbi:hypothetical protein [Streptomyces sp. NPDC059256]|uniref:hypothetical protein n=1 Tax=Streptomyces sp. NPDC059256 TaxID=3346794 RepID=UPI0036AA51FE